MENEYEKVMIEKAKKYARKQKYYESTNKSTSSSSAHDYNVYDPDFIDNNEYKPKNVFSFTSGVYEDDDDDKPILPKVEKEIEEEHKGPPKADTEPSPEVFSQPKYNPSYEDRGNFRWAIKKKLFKKGEIQKWATSLGLTNPVPVPVPVPVPDPVPEQDDEDEGNQGDGKIKLSEGLYDDQIDKVMSKYKDFKGCIMKDQIKTLLPDSLGLHS